MQHDETVLPEMLRRDVRTGDVDVVAGTRHREGGSMGELAWARGALSQLRRRLSALACPRRCLRPHERLLRFGGRDYLDEVVRRLSFAWASKSWSSCWPPPNAGSTQEVGYTFRKRLQGKGKLDLVVGARIPGAAVAQLVGGMGFRVRYALFGMIGANWRRRQCAHGVLALFSAVLPFDTAR